MKIYFFGTPKFAVPCLKMLSLDPDIQILGVITQENKKGNRNIVTPPPVKEAAERLGIPVIQTEKIDAKLIEKIKVGKPDAIIVVAYGGLIPKDLLSVPKFGCVNIHPSLLPKYRGASPIQEALLNGDTETGIAIMELDEQLDHGKIFLIKRVTIDKEDTYETLSAKLSQIAAIILPLALTDIKEGDLVGIKQDDSKATFCKKISKEEGEIDFNKTSEEIINQIRALNPWPSTFIKIKGKVLKITEVKEVTEEDKLGKPGTTKIIDKKTFGFYTKNGLLIPTKLKMEGKKEMTTEEFLNGYRSLVIS